MVSGHTHGGQVVLPLLGGRFAPVRDHRYLAGLEPWSGHLVQVSRGIGNLYGIRFNCPPEINLIELHGPDVAQPVPK
jgi:predicted MPP superfamily phosphohydrolase